MVVAKQDGRQVSNKNGEERGTLSFTIRDTSAIVNVTYWGTFQFIQQLTHKYVWFISIYMVYINKKVS